MSGNNDSSCPYKFFCTPCWVHSVEGCSGMTICCWIACCFTWPINGCVGAFCYEPVNKQVAQQGYAGH